MAQVYAFTDTNGETRLFAEIHPEPAFNGGTITGPLAIAPSDASATPLRVTGASGQLADYAFIEDSNGNSLIEVDSSGFLDAYNGLQAGGGTVQAPNSIVLLVLATSGQTANIERVEDGNGAVVRKVLAGGATVFANHAAPADNTLLAGDCSLWFDQTNGASKLMVKGKSANGTVVSGSVTLT